MREKEAEIKELFDSPEEFRELTRPTAAFVTFEEEDAKNLALDAVRHNKDFMG